MAEKALYGYPFYVMACFILVLLFACLVVLLALGIAGVAFTALYVSTVPAALVIVASSCLLLNGSIEAWLRGRHKDVQTFWREFHFAPWWEKLLIILHKMCLLFGVIADSVFAVMGWAKNAELFYDGVVVDPTLFDLFKWAGIAVAALVVGLFLVMWLVNQEKRGRPREDLRYSVV